MMTSKLTKMPTMTEEDKAYMFETATRNNHKKVLPTQQDPYRQKNVVANVRLCTR